MKTTLDLPDDLLARARRAAQREGTTLRALVEEGLQLSLRARAAGPQRTRFSIMPFEGDGLTAEFVGASWPQTRDEIHGRRFAADDGSSEQDES
jgi:Bacterial antitoxin of type II TA system, VapB